MRVWTVEAGETFEGEDTRWLCVDGERVADVGWPATAVVEQFIIDACNAAEEEAAIIAEKGPVAEATQRFRALELSQAEADAACSLIHQRVRPEPRVVHVHRSWPALKAYPPSGVDKIGEKP